MIAESTRPFTVDETKRLHRECCAAIRQAIARIVIASLFVGFLAWLAVIALWNYGYEMLINGRSMRELGIQSPWTVQTIGWAFAAVAAFVCFRYMYPNLTWALRKKASIATARVRILHVQALGVVEYESMLDSQSPMFFFDVGDGRILLMFGQTLSDIMYKPEYDREFAVEGEEKAFQIFPCTEFIAEYETVFDSRISLKLCGQFLEPKEKLPHRDWMLPPSDRIFPGTLESIDRDLAAQQAKEPSINWSRDR